MTHPTGRRRCSVFAAGLAAMAMALGFAAPAEAAPPIAYVALGDSYAAGQGAAPYQKTCYRSDSSYPGQADAAKSVRLAINAACSGATTEDVVATQLRRLNPSIKLVTITVGGNDLDTTGLLATCFTVPAACEGAFLARAALLAEAESNPSQSQLVQGLANIGLSVRAQAPNAKIVFTGYPMLFDPAFPDPRASLVNQLTAGLNGVIERVALSTGAHYVDVVPAFIGHGIGSTDSWINFDGIPNPTEINPSNFHPTAEGYQQGYYASLVSKLPQR